MNPPSSRLSEVGTSQGRQDDRMDRMNFGILPRMFADSSIREISVIRGGIFSDRLNVQLPTSNDEVMIASSEGNTPLSGGGDEESA